MTEPPEGWWWTLERGYSRRFGRPEITSWYKAQGWWHTRGYEDGYTYSTVAETAEGAMAELVKILSTNPKKHD